VKSQGGKVSDVTASTHKERKAPKMVSHLEVHPNMEGGHNVVVHHTNPVDHPPKEKEFSGPHDSVVLPKGHILESIAKHMNIHTTGAGAGAGAGSEEPIDDKEAGEMA
jgi:hypothetical protein